MQQFMRAVVVVCLMLSGCTEVTTTSSGMFGDDVSVERRSYFKPRDETPGDTDGVLPGSLFRGTDEFVNPDGTTDRRPSKAVIVPRDGKTVEISLINASIPAAAKAVLGDTFNEQFIVSDEVTGTITIQSTNPIPKDALLELFEAALAANDAQLQRDGNIVKIVPGSSGNRTFRLASQGADNGATILVAPMKFISAIQMAELLTPLIEDGLTAIPDRKRNLIMLSGTKAQLEAALEALNLFDVDVLQGKSVALVQLNSADPEAIVDELRQIFESEEGGNLEGVIEFIPNKRLGSVLIITSRSRYLPRAQKWIRQLDRTAAGTDLVLATYELQNRNAVDIAPILSELLANGTGTTDGDEPAAAGPGPRVAADKARNALIVKATRSVHREIKQLLNEIDSSPQQVMLEATIAEVTLNDQVGAGLRWFFRAGNFDFRFSDLNNGAVTGSNPGFSAVFGGNGVEVALSALAGVTDVKIISSPTLMVLDNEEALLQIGDEVPIATETSVDTSNLNAPTVTRIEYRDTGIILRVTPIINRNGRVVLDVQQEISDVTTTNTSGIDSPTIRQRRISTHVLLADGATLALGGLIQESDNVTKTKVPGLGDVPFLGAAFRNTETTKRRTELLILIRPRIVSTDDSAQRISEYYRNKLGSVNSLLDTGLGPVRHTLDEVLR